jgi:3'-phosphoadenosine 5'-phosphosulfate sulfotransferase (PAPS reductase)/FAD synthetase
MDLDLDLVFAEFTWNEEARISDRIGSGLSLFPCMMHPSPIQHPEQEQEREKERERERERERGRERGRDPWSTLVL